MYGSLHKHGLVCTTSSEAIALMKGWDQAVRVEDFAARGWESFHN
jgi:hypothetical protein